MKLLVSLGAVAIGLLFGCVVAAICENEDREAADFDVDEDGGFIDDWRLP